MHPSFKIMLEHHRKEMYLFGVLCLLSAAVALPMPEQLHTNIPAPPPPPELKSEENDRSNERVVTDDQIRHPKPNVEEAVFDKSEEDKKPSDSAEKPKAEKDVDISNPDDIIKVIVDEPKDSKEANDSKEKSKESMDDKELESEFGHHEEIDEPKEIEEPKESEEEKKESISEESKDGDKEDIPFIVQIIKKPFTSSFFSDMLAHFGWPQLPWGSLFRDADQQDEQDQPILYIVKESDFEYQ